MKAKYMTVHSKFLMEMGKDSVCWELMNIPTEDQSRILDLYKSNSGYMIEYHNFPYKLLGSNS